MDDAIFNQLLLKMKGGDADAINDICKYFRDCCNNLIRKTQCLLYPREEIWADIDVCTVKCCKRYKESNIKEFKNYTMRSIKNNIYVNLNSTKKYAKDISLDNCIYYSDETLENFICYDERIYEPFDEKVCLKLDFDILKQIILKLNASDREVLNFIVVGHHNYKEYSALKNKSLDAAYQQYHRAIERLKTRYVHY